MSSFFFFLIYEQISWPSFLKKIIYLFIYLCIFLAVLGLRFCARAFSSCGEQGPLLITVRGRLTIAASLVAEPRLQMRRLSNCGSGPSCSTACGIFPDQVSNPCPLHWQADSQPLRHQGSPSISSYKDLMKSKLLWVLFVVFSNNNSRFRMYLDI